MEDPRRIRCCLAGGNKNAPVFRMRFLWFTKVCTADSTSREGKFMYIIPGLGNPTSKYEHTRHNVGFEVIDRLAEEYHISVDTKKHRALLGKGVIEGQRVILMKPQTFMNLSGESIREVLEYYKTEPDQLIVIYDDISLPPGQIRIRAKGSAGGHNGVKNIILQLATQEFPRVKVGIGEKPPRMDLADYVLSRFDREDREAVDRAEQEAVQAVVKMLEGNLEAAMNAFNGKKGEKNVRVV